MTKVEFLGVILSASSSWEDREVYLLEYRLYPEEFVWLTPEVPLRQDRVHIGGVWAGDATSLGSCKGAGTQGSCAESLLKGSAFRDFVKAMGLTFWTYDILFLASFSLGGPDGQQDEVPGQCGWCLQMQGDGSSTPRERLFDC